MKFPSFFPRIFHPPVYQGKSNPKNYFEGWYYKHVDESGEEIWSIIFGVSYSDDPHSFIQVIEGRHGKTDYLRFDLEDFSADKNRLRVTIGNNTITHSSIQLDLQGENYKIKGGLIYRKIRAYPQRLLSPGIMGWYTFVPFMECYHGVVSMNHHLSGSLEINEKTISFTGGRGYIEKDWGSSMPSDWLWLHCNHFDQHDDVSVMISIARIPWLNGFFPGFLSFVQIGEKVYRFATYNRSSIDHLLIQDNVIDLVLKNRKYKLEVDIKRSKSGLLKAPVKGNMERKISESLDAELAVKLSAASGKIIFEDRGIHSGLEVVGDIAKYIK